MLLQHAVVGDPEGAAGASLRAATEAGVAAAKSGRASMEKVARRENMLILQELSERASCLGTSSFDGRPLYPASKRKRDGIYELPALVGYCDRVCTPRAMFCAISALQNISKIRDSEAVEYIAFVRADVDYLCSSQ